LTGSDTSSNALFDGLHLVSAEQLNISPTLMAPVNSSRGVMGKMMIDAQSIVGNRRDRRYKFELVINIKTV
jgi:L-lactate permease